LLIRFIPRWLWILLSLTVSGSVWAVSLGNLSILSKAEQALDARIALLIPADEVAQLNALEVHIGSQASYDRLGILRPNIEALPRIWIAKDAAQRPAFIRLQYLQPTAVDESVFRDVVVELKWATGKLTRVYTLINPTQVKREVQYGENLSLIATELADDFPGIKASQVMLALYRTNPKAFVSGSIHRLKAGEVLAVPSANMASSISSAEANQFVRSALNDLTQGMATRSSNEVFLNRSDRTNVDTLGQDRLQVGSAQEESVASLNQAKRDEELIAQQKLLEQARDRVAQLEKNIADLNQLMGIVTQESILFNDTIFNNIAFGNKSASREAVIAAAKIANADEFIVKLTDGYDTNIGDRGSKLSGGQRQRLSIARAVLKNPPILILDEATSALDTESEKLVQDAIHKLMQNRTSIVIAHRLSTIQHADTIVVMQDGKIIEKGKHAELISMNGTYKKLTDMQSFQ